MLNYLGPNIGPAPVAASLPTGPAGTMPSAVPGVPPSAGVSPGPISPISPRAMPIAPPLAAAINPANAGTPPPPSDEEQNPADIQYDTLTQEDGTVVMFIKKADGTRGPAVKIVSVKAPKAPAA